MSVILGLASSHDASACVFIDGQLAAAVSQERVTRRKNDGCRLPLEAMEHALEVVPQPASASRQSTAQQIGRIAPDFTPAPHEPLECAPHVRDSRSCIVA